MSGIALGGAVIGAAGGMWSANKQAKTAKELAKQQQQYGSAGATALEQQKAAQGAQLWASDQNKSNQLWANDQNRQNMLWSQNQNKSYDQTNAFGNTLGYDAEGNQIQKFGGADQATLDALRGQRDSAIGGMSNKFNVQGDVMNAYRALNDPLQQQSRDKENARLAAMGLSTGSGSAWENSQRSINDAQTRSDQNAILAGFQADQALQQSNRANLGALNTTQNTLQSGLGQAAMPQIGSTTVNAPTVSAMSPDLMNAWSQDMGNMSANAVNQSNAAGGWGNLAGSLGGAVGKMDLGSMFGGNTATKYGTTPGSQQSSMLAAQDAGMGGSWWGS